MAETIIRTYTELSKIESFGDRLLYLQLEDSVGRETFGVDRYLNQRFYRSPEWIAVRNAVIVRDYGCDLGVTGFRIDDEPIIIHHMNPIQLDDILDGADWILDPEFLITTTDKTHRLIHYRHKISTIDNGVLISRSKYDTCPWRK